MSDLYFAYGSNLLSTRLTARCPGSEPLGVAFFKGHRLAFPLSSAHDGSGKAGVVADAASTVEGRLYRMAPQDVPDLDRIEGLNYVRTPVQVHQETEQLAAFTYIPKRTGPEFAPYDWYLGLILWGARQAKLSETAYAALRQTPWRPDPEVDRPGLLAAEAAFEAAGITAWRQVLG
ncbi:MAG: gamma-glutamylcyclotransferase family protein [Pseudomonadota bacterium]